MSSWQTTAIGILIATAVVYNAWRTGEAVSVENLIAILTSIGLLAARDNDKSSRRVGAK